MNQENERLESTAPSVSTSSAYEFTPTQNLTLQVLSHRMKFIGLLYLVFAGIVGIAGISMLLTSLAQALAAFLEVVFFAFLGLWTYRGAAAFRLIVETRGSDISHLMDALENLRRIYNLQFWLMIGMLGLIALAIIAAVVLSAGA